MPEKELQYVPVFKGKTGTQRKRHKTKRGITITMGSPNWYFSLMLPLLLTLMLSMR